MQFVNVNCCLRVEVFNIVDPHLAVAVSADGCDKLLENHGGLNVSNDT